MPRQQFKYSLWIRKLFTWFPIFMWLHRCKIFLQVSLYFRETLSHNWTTSLTISPLYRMNFVSLDSCIIMSSDLSSKRWCNSRWAELSRRREERIWSPRWSPTTHLVANVSPSLRTILKPSQNNMFMLFAIILLLSTGTSSQPLLAKLLNSISLCWLLATRYRNSWDLSKVRVAKRHCSIYAPKCSNVLHCSYWQERYVPQVIVARRFPWDIPWY